MTEKQIGIGGHTVDSILRGLSRVETKEELDAYRLPLIQVSKGKEEEFRTLQKAFIKAKNRLIRIPIKKRK